jgi:hypothetical protein
VDGVAVHEQSTLAEGLARQPQRVGVVPLLGPGVDHKLEVHVVPVLEVTPARLDAVGREARHHDDVLDAYGAEVGKGEIENRAAVRKRQQRLRQVVGERLQPAPGARGEDDSLHQASSMCTRLRSTRSQLRAASATK